MTSDKDVFWKTIFNKIFENFNVHLLLGENFDKSVWHRYNTGSKFYKEIIDAWSAMSKTTINNRKDVLRQNIWFNSQLNLGADSCVMKTLMNKGMVKIGHLWNKNAPYGWNEIKQKGLDYSEYLAWRGILDAIPKSWREKLKSPLENDEHQTFKSAINIEVSGQLYSIEKIKTKTIYWKCASLKFKPPTAKKIFKKG